MSYTTRLCERVMEQRVRRKIKISENQFGFMLERSTVEAIFSLKQFMKNYREEEKSSYCLNRPRESLRHGTRDLIRWVLDKRSVPRDINIIKDMYE